jgi:hypothetical protein
MMSGEGTPFGGDNLLVTEERLDLLVRLLNLSGEGSDTTQLRHLLLADMEVLQRTFAAAMRRQLVPAAIAALTDRGILHVPAHEDGCRSALIAQLAMANRLHSERRQVLLDTLTECVGALNRVGIEPLLLKGAVSLVSGKPAWRTQRDIDFAVAPNEAHATVEALRLAGFHEVPDHSARPHHLHPLTREGFPATLEPHVMLGGARARSVLPDDMLWSTMSSVDHDGKRYQLLSPAAFALHGLGHHYFQNRGYLFGTMSLKGLLEFCFAVQDMDENDARSFCELSESNAHLAAGVSVVCATASDLLGLRPPEGLAFDEGIRRVGRDMATRMMTGMTQNPLRSAAMHAGTARRTSGSVAAGVASLQRGLRDALHTAVWFDQREQRRNASGILQDL